jgi:hypothetical protein
MPVAPLPAPAAKGPAGEPLGGVEAHEGGEERRARPWPPHVPGVVIRAATPEFRALLVGCVMTAQRGGDVTRFTPGQYRP